MCREMVATGSGEAGSPLGCCACEQTSHGAQRGTAHNNICSLHIAAQRSSLVICRRVHVLPRPPTPQLLPPPPSSHKSSRGTHPPTHPADVLLHQAGLDLPTTTHTPPTHLSPIARPPARPPTRLMSCCTRLAWNSSIRSSTLSATASASCSACMCPRGTGRSGGECATVPAAHGLLRAGRMSVLCGKAPFSEGRQIHSMHAGVDQTAPRAGGAASPSCPAWQNGRRCPPAGLASAL